MSGWWVLAKTASSETESKRSRFLCTLWPIQSLTEGQQVIRQQKQQHPQAAHVCSAMLLPVGPTGQPQAFSDDGEPSGTAGKPMLAVLQGSGMVGICASVVRYYGGVQLGTGGLVRAYSDSVRQALLSAQREFIPIRHQADLCLSYAAFETMQRLWQNRWLIEQQEFDQQVRLTVRIAQSDQQEFEQQFMQTILRLKELQASISWHRNAEQGS
ncbi:IMPACT family protein [Rheinheimera soli]|uniref:IMPACT family protein n=1 Tax=Rheinheimera soli TaxID=443616 RepID=UPI001E37A3F7|nr:YigZ family protein [Rheinheimera soli]